MGGESKLEGEGENAGDLSDRFALDGELRLSPSPDGFLMEAHLM